MGDDDSDDEFLKSLLRPRAPRTVDDDDAAEFLMSLLRPRARTGDDDDAEDRETRATPLAGDHHQPARGAAACSNASEPARTAPPAESGAPESGGYYHWPAPAAHSNASEPARSAQPAGDHQPARGAACSNASEPARTAPPAETGVSESGVSASGGPYHWPAPAAHSRMPAYGSILYNIQTPGIGQTVHADCVKTHIAKWVHSSGDALQYTIGITWRPRHRFYNEKYGYAGRHFSFLEVLVGGSARGCRALETRLIDDLMGNDPRCMNRARGGGGVSKDDPQHYYLYVAWAEKPLLFSNPNRPCLS